MADFENVMAMIDCVQLHCMVKILICDYASAQAANEYTESLEISVSLRSVQGTVISTCMHARMLCFARAGVQLECQLTVLLLTRAADQTSPLLVM